MNIPSEYELCEIRRGTYTLRYTGESKPPHHLCFTCHQQGRPAQVLTHMQEPVLPIVISGHPTTMRYFLQCPKDCVNISVPKEYEL